MKAARQRPAFRRRDLRPWSGMSRSNNLDMWIVALFASVVAHEVAHCVVARRHGAHVLGIVAFPLAACHKLTPCQKHRVTSWLWPSSPFLAVAHGTSWDF